MSSFLNSSVGKILILLMVCGHMIILWIFLRWLRQLWTFSKQTGSYLHAYDATFSFRCICGATKHMIYSTLWKAIAKTFLRQIYLKHWECWLVVLSLFQFSVLPWIVLVYVIDITTKTIKNKLFFDICNNLYNFY